MSRRFAAWRDSAMFLGAVLLVPAAVVATVALSLELGRGEGFVVWLLAAGVYVLLFAGSTAAALHSRGSAEGQRGGG